MHSPERFSFIRVDDVAGEAGLLPLLPLTLSHQNHSIAASGLLDTGATVNVLPHRIGLQLGAVWNSSAPPIRLTGNLAQFEAQPLVVSARVGEFDQVRLAFAWTRTDDVRLILGLVNFLLEFDVCFYRSQHSLDIRPRRRS